MNINLRPHHLMCMQNFIGKGYSFQFVSNTFAIIHYLNSREDDKIIRIVSGEDALCQMCPNRGLGRCYLAIKHDNDYFKALRLDYSKRYSLNNVRTLINRYIDYQTFFSICENCKWISICSKIMKLKQIPDFKKKTLL